MSAFTGPLRYESTDDFVHGRRVYRLRAPVVYFVGAKNSSVVLIVKQGFRTDLASVPALFRGLFAPDGPWAQAAVVHDWLYREGALSRLMADLILFEAAGVLGVSWWRRACLFAAVRFGGARAYGRHAL